MDSVLQQRTLKLKNSVIRKMQRRIKKRACIAARGGTMANLHCLDSGGLVPLPHENAETTLQRKSIEAIGEVGVGASAMTPETIERSARWRDRERRAQASQPFENGPNLMRLNASLRGKRGCKASSMGIRVLGGVPNCRNGAPLRGKRGREERARRR